MGLENRPEWLLMAVLAVVAVLGGYLIHERMIAFGLAEQQAEVLDATNDIANSLESQVQGLGSIARSLANLAQLDESLITNNFAEIASVLVDDNPVVLNVALAPGMVVEQAYPVERGNDLIGLDLSASGASSEVAMRAFDERQVTLGGPFVAADGSRVLVTAAPFYRIQPPAGDNLVWGLVSVTAGADAVMSASGIAAFSGELDISLVPQLSGAGGSFAWGAPELRDREPLIREIAVPGGIWQLLVAPREGWTPTLGVGQIWLLSAYTVGALVILSSIAFIGRVSRQRHEAEHRLRGAIEALDHGFVIFDNSDRFVMCNQAYRNFYSEAAELLRPGVPFRRIITEGVRRGQIMTPHENEEAWIEERMALHNTPNSQSTQQLADGTWLKIDERHLPDGSVVGLRIDITEIIQAHAEAEKAYKAKTEFISVLSHELRTPLTVILGYAKVLSNLHLLKNYRSLREEIDAIAEISPSITNLLEDFVTTLKQQGEKIDRSGRHLLVLINDLLDYSKIEAGHFELKFEPTELRSICDSLLDEHSGAAETKGIVLIDEIKNITVDLDPVRFKQIMINLLGNAIKFTDSGSITLRNSFANGMVRIDVVDTGCGVKPDMIESIFDAFQQADYSDTRRAGGTGLGLAISRQIAALHGGTLTATSVEGEGSCFSVEIPIQRVDEDGLSEIRPRSVLSRLIA
jgi:signal transduction histidine kinase